MDSLYVLNSLFVLNFLKNETDANMGLLYQIFLRAKTSMLATKVLSETQTGFVSSDDFSHLLAIFPLSLNQFYV